ncbi:MAG: EamA family transporter [Gammaproteobacteria bacterium]
MHAARPDQPVAQWQVWAALGIVYVVWGSTYLAIRVMVRTMPPLLAGGTRHVMAALIIFVLLVLWRGRGALRMRRSEVIGGAVVGLLLLLGGNGLVVLGEQQVPSGLAALIVAVVPLCVVVLRWMFREHIARGTILGVLAGFIGVAILIVPEGVSGRVDTISMLMLVGAAISWSVGSYMSKRLDMPHEPLASTGVQLIVGGAALLATGAVTGEQVHPETFGTDSVVALIYLITFGSVLAYTAYTWVLIHASVSRVSTYAYVNPVVAVALGGLLLNEQLDLTMMIGAAVIVVAVWLVIRTEGRKPSLKSGAVEAEPVA